AAGRRAGQYHSARDGRRPDGGAVVLVARFEYGRLDAGPRGGLAMRKKRNRREIETLSLSFLDAVSCGFGAIILLLVITKLFEPIRLEESQEELDSLIVRYEEQLEDILGETEIVQRERNSTIQDVDENQVQIAQLE